MNKIIDKNIFCDNCGKNTCTKRYEIQSVDHGSKEELITVDVKVPVYHCESCGAEYTDSEADQLIHEAICKKLELLSPSEIIGIRQKQNVSQASFAEITGIGVASIKRWESGIQLQNKSIDKYLRLLSIDANYQYLIHVNKYPKFTPHFQTELSPAAYEEQGRFRLRI